MTETKRKTETKIPLTHRTYAKVTAFILCVIFFGTAFLIGGVGTVVASSLTMYTRSESDVEKNFFNSIAYDDAYLFLDYISQNEQGAISNYCESENIYSFTCKESNTATVYTNYRSNQPYQKDKQYFTYQYSGMVLTIYDKETQLAEQPTAKQSSTERVTEPTTELNTERTTEPTTELNTERTTEQPTENIPLTVYDEETREIFEEDKNQDIFVDVEMEVLVENNRYAFWKDFLVFLYSAKYTMPVVGMIGLIFSLMLFIFLMRSSGHRAGSTKITPSWGTKIPLDLLAGGVFLLTLTFMLIIDDNIRIQNTNDAVLWIGMILLFVIICSVMVIGFCMSFALRWKLGKWWKNTLIYRILRLFVRVFTASWHWTVTFFRKLPLIRKTVLIIVGIMFYEFFCMLFCDAMGGYYPMFGFFLFLEKVILIPFVLYIALCLRKFQRHTQEMAGGNFTKQISDDNLIGDFKAYAHTLNNISYGMALAVEQRMKSERMKTELITNVSHDIKTPLTSIINYSDLICREQTDNPQITEYAEVLSRQSAKLKRLIEDLVEASKASTGNLEINPAPCEANIFMVQTVGEYSEKLEQQGLELVTSSPDYPVMIMADGHRLWRVFDNLMNNICKYSQKHTRVYIILEKVENQAVFIFKNTSHLQLNMSADELMERFVRGDTSRSTEGNGLGLSIAKSLTELQNGKFTLLIDGDLFKVILKFPVIPDSNTRL